MESPPVSPPRLPGLRRSISPAIDMGGSSRTTGGLLHGRAYGNVYNHADSDELMNFNTMGPRTGCVQVYMKHVDPMATKAHMVLKHEVSSKLKPILKSLARGYSPVRSKLPISFTDKYIDFCRQQSSHFCLRR